MSDHKDMWNRVDSLARRHDLTPSGLARRAGLDPTTFNPSKRTSKAGRERWPSSESLAKAIAAVGENWQTFFGGGDVSYSQERRRASVPLLGLAEAGQGGYFDDAGFPAGHGWQEVELPEPNAKDLIAVTVSGDSMLPLYRDGDIVVASRSQSPRRGDRVLLRTRNGEVMAKVLNRRSAGALELHSLNSEHEPRTLFETDMDWIARIVWVSQ